MKYKHWNFTQHLFLRDQKMIFNLVLAETIIRLRQIQMFCMVSYEELK